jgi:hypothetical protein
MNKSNSKAIFSTGNIKGSVLKGSSPPPFMDMGQQQQSDALLPMFMKGGLVGSVEEKIRKNKFQK